jgi:hypothetical protein
MILISSAVDKVLIDVGRCPVLYDDLGNRAIVVITIAVTELIDLDWPGLENSGRRESRCYDGGERDSVVERLRIGGILRV